jgi:glycosyltransferase involved in cell wall biosynthesis
MSGQGGEFMTAREVCLVAVPRPGSLLEDGAFLETAGLAELLTRSGLAVTLLMLPVDGHRVPRDTLEWRCYLEQQGVRVAWLPQTPPVRIGAWAHPSLSYRVLLWLREHRFDIVYFPDRGGYAYYTMLAKFEGLAFHHTILCVMVGGPTLWAQATGLAPLPAGSIEELNADFMERQCLLLADAASCSNSHILAWLNAEGWRIPGVVAACGTVSPRIFCRRTPPNARPTREVVLLVRLERERDLELLCSGLDIVATRSAHELRVLALSTTPSDQGRSGLAYLAHRARRWRWPFRATAGCAWRDVMAYLRCPDRVAVAAPSVCAVASYPWSLIAAGVPALFPAAPGIPGLVAEEDRSRTTFELTPAGLAEKLLCVVERGPQPARPAVDVETTERAWISWHDALRLLHPNPAPDGPPAPQPLVSVCVTHRNRPRYLAQALASIRAQDYANLEVIVVDDGSTDPGALRYLDQVQAEFARRGWHLVRQENRFLGASRNAAVRHSHGKYVLFMDDDNYAKPNEVSTLVAVAERTNADVLTCFKDVFFGDAPPNPGRPPLRRDLALGPSVAVGVFENAAGDANALVRREAFDRVDGFTEEYGVGAEDQNFFVRAVVAGLTLLVVPETLYWYRVHRSSMLDTTHYLENHLHGARPALVAAPPELRALLLYALGEYTRDRYSAPAGVLAFCGSLLRAVRRWLASPNRRALLQRFCFMWFARSPEAALGRVARFGRRA